ncbi:conserved protein of unknown function(Protein of unknown function DUF4415,41-96) [Magnetospirillum sp. XM-1]|uniref:BrnA antitoxin family protein n=1 Tax=Magnetospirillum sp. XM-1 TaxID=1663591 RepID=UPI00073E046D|nr:BrnA antitoxin family protein [Magnetospirillum sp. XM-1]CUW38683.1 conserved protein of unknown function(Protein of unknown function DUF4415,41-96) [Magnetospirillum sp. XM-1]
MSEERIIRRSLTERRKSKTDWARVKALPDSAIDAAIAADPDAAPVLDEEWFRTAELVMPQPKAPISIRVDREVLDWFKSQGPGYQSRMNAVLAAYVKAHGKRD